jgi:hypothetical protein
MDLSDTFLQVDGPPVHFTKWRQKLVVLSSTRVNLPPPPLASLPSTCPRSCYVRRPNLSSSPPLSVISRTPQPPPSPFSRTHPPFSFSSRCQPRLVRPPPLALDVAATSVRHQCRPPPIHPRHDTSRARKRRKMHVPPLAAGSHASWAHCPNS